MKRLTTFALAIGAMLTLATVAGAGPNTESAQGGYTLGGGQYEFAFSAKATLQNTNASGHFKFTNHGTDPDTILDGDVTCLFVGPLRTATLGGTVTSYTGPGGSTVWRSFSIAVKDNGQGPTAFMSDTSGPLVLGQAPAVEADCSLGLVIGQTPISSGDITVKPALP